jgi:hypothetical protein
LLLAAAKAGGELKVTSDSIHEVVRDTRLRNLTPA